MGWIIGLGTAGAIPVLWDTRTKGSYGLGSCPGIIP